MSEAKLQTVWWVEPERKHFHFNLVARHIASMVVILLPNGILLREGDKGSWHPLNPSDDSGPLYLTRQEASDAYCALLQAEIDERQALIDKERG